MGKASILKRADLIVLHKNQACCSLSETHNGIMEIELFGNGVSKHKNTKPRFFSYYVSPDRPDNGNKGIRKAMSVFIYSLTIVSYCFIDVLFRVKNPKK